MKPEFSKPFDLVAARAGAPYCCRNGAEATVLKWDCNHPHYPLIGVICENGFHYPESWTASGTQASDEELERRPGRDLVMLPMGLIEGKPVFYRDEYVHSDGEVVTALPMDMSSGFAGAKWPAPAKVYPETTLSPDHLRAAYDSDLGGSVDAAVRRVANAALRHAIDAGQMVVVDWDAPARAARDMSIAEAVRSHCGKLVGGSHIAQIDLANLIATIQ